MASDEHSGRTAIYALAGVIAAATLAFLGSQWAARTAFDAQMVQIGVSILSADPSKSDVAPAREWAMKLVEEHSGLPFSDRDRDSLLHHPLDLATAWKTPPMIVKCGAFHKKPDGSWEPNPGSGYTAKDFAFMDKYLDAYCGAVSDFWWKHFKAG